jgi:hypothetical protein
MEEGWLLMEEWLEDRFPIQIVARPGRGRCVVAADDLRAGTTIMASAPAAFACHLATRCSMCLQRPPAPSGPQRCGACKGAAYCSRECQKADWQADHKVECKAVGGLAQALGAALLKRDPALLDKTVLAARVVRGRRLASWPPRHAPGAAAGAGIGTSARAFYTPTMEDVRGLHADSSPEAEADCMEAARAALEVGLLPSVDAAAQMAALLMAFDVNNFSITDALQVSLAGAVYPAGALLNHSCAPNCVISYASGPPTPAAAGTSAAVADGRHIQHIRLIADVTAGTELCHSYVEIAQPRYERRARLRHVYGFDCNCSACAAKNVGSPLDTDAFLLAPSAVAAAGAGEAAAVQGAGTRRMRAPLPGIDPSARADSHAAFAPYYVPAAEGSGDVPAPSPAVDALPEGPAQRDLFNSAVAAFSAERDPFSERAVKLLPPAAALAPRDAALVKACGANGLSARDVMSELRSIHLLEHALALRRRHLHPLHVDVIPLVSALLARYLVVDDVPSALAACGHIVAFYRHAYVSCPLHPMLGLQLFTMADLLNDLAARLASGGVAYLTTVVRGKDVLLTQLFVELAGEGDDAAAASDAPSHASYPRFAGLKLRACTPASARFLAPDDVLAAARDAYRECYQVLLVTAGADDDITRGAGMRYRDLQASLGGADGQGGAAAKAGAGGH